MLYFILFSEGHLVLTSHNSFYLFFFKTVFVFFRLATDSLLLFFRSPEVSSFLLLISFNYCLEGNFLERIIWQSEMMGS